MHVAFYPLHEYRIELGTFLWAAQHQKSCGGAVQYIFVDSNAVMFRHMQRQVVKVKSGEGPDKYCEKGRSGLSLMAKP